MVSCLGARAAGDPLKSIILKLNLKHNSPLENYHKAPPWVRD